MAYDFSIFDPQQYSLGLGQAAPAQFGAMDNYQYQPQSMDNGMGMSTLDIQSMLDPQVQQGMSMPPSSAPAQLSPTPTPPRKGALQSIADMIAGDQYPDVTAADKDRAMGNALMTLGTALVGAANAGSWTKAAPMIGGAIPLALHTGEAYLNQYNKQRQENVDRAQLLRTRAMQEKSSALDLRKKTEDYADTKAQEDALSNSWKDMQSNYYNIIESSDLPDSKKAMYKANFDILGKSFNAAPTLEGRDKILEYMTKTAQDAGKGDEILRMVHEDFLHGYEAAKTADPSLTMDEYKKIMKLDFLNTQKISGLKVEAAQANVSNALASAEQRKAYAARAETAAKAYAENTKKTDALRNSYSKGWDSLGKDPSFQGAIKSAIQENDYTELQNFIPHLKALGITDAEKLFDPSVSDEKKKAALSKVIQFLQNPAARQSIASQLYPYPQPSPDLSSPWANSPDAYNQ